MSSVINNSNTYKCVLLIRKSSNVPCWFSLVRVSISRSLSQTAFSPESKKRMFTQRWHPTVLVSTIGSIRFFHSVSANQALLHHPISEISFLSLLLDSEIILHRNHITFTLHQRSSNHTLSSFLQGQDCVQKSIRDFFLRFYSHHPGSFL